jgi:hypothetical protein
VLIAVAALLLLVPCSWQPHILAGDLPSHLYNAWLAGQIEQGNFPPQLSLAHPITNVLRRAVINALADGKPDRSQQQQKQGRNHASFAKKDEQVCKRKEKDERDVADQRAGGLFKYGNQRAG